jgi:hypothetical protein
MLVPHTHADYLPLLAFPVPERADEFMKWSKRRHQFEPLRDDIVIVRRNAGNSSNLGLH